MMESIPLLAGYSRIFQQNPLSRKNDSNPAFSQKNSCFRKNLTFIQGFKFIYARIWKNFEFARIMRLNSNDLNIDTFIYFVRCRSISVRQFISNSGWDLKESEKIGVLNVHCTSPESGHFSMVGFRSYFIGNEWFLYRN